LWPGATLSTGHHQAVDTELYSAPSMYRCRLRINVNSAGCRAFPKHQFLLKSLLRVWFDSTIGIGVCIPQPLWLAFQFVSGKCIEWFPFDMLCCVFCVCRGTYMCGCWRPCASQCASGLIVLSRDYVIIRAFWFHHLFVIYKHTIYKACDTRQFNECVLHDWGFNIRGVFDCWSSERTRHLNIIFWALRNCNGHVIIVLD